MSKVGWKPTAPASARRKTGFTSSSAALSSAKKSSGMAWAKSMRKPSTTNSPGKPLLFDGQEVGATAPDPCPDRPGSPPP